MTPSLSRRLLVAGAAAVAVGGLVWQLGGAGTHPLFPPYDFVEYWAAGRLALDGRDPYDAAALLELQRPLGPPDRTEDLTMWNPPWALPLVMPLGALPPGIGQVVWLVVSLGAVLACAHLLWRGFEGPAEYRWVGWLTAVTFAPTVFVLTMGQISALLLLGFVGFAFLLRAGRPTAAGAVAALTALKPHLFALFAVLFLLEAVRHRATRRAAVAGVVVLAVFAVLPMLWVPDVWTRYAEAAVRPTGPGHVRTADWHQPAVGYLLRELVPGRPVWVQFVPLGAGLVAAPAYWWVRRRRWDWVAESPQLSMAFVLTAGYGAWAFDLVVLLPAVIWAAVRVVRCGRPVRTGLAAAVYFVLNLACALTMTRPLSQDNPWIGPSVLAGVALVAWLFPATRPPVHSEPIRPSIPRAPA
jgi:hypothetical protein